MGPFAKDYFVRLGKSTDFQRVLTRDYFYSVTHHWLDVYHVDGIRYDCVPNDWDGSTGVGYANAVFRAYERTKQKVVSGVVPKPTRSSSSTPATKTLWIPFWFPIAGNHEEIHGGSLD